MGSIRIMTVIARMNVGGPAELLATLARGLPPGRFDHTLVTGWCGPDEIDYLQTHTTGIEVVRIDGLGRAPRPRDDVRALTALTQLVRRTRPHIVHTHTAKAGLIGRTAAMMAETGSSRIHTFHGHLLQGYFGPFTTRAIVSVERQLAKVTHRLVAVGAQVRDDLLAEGVGSQQQWRVIPPGVSTPLSLGRAEARDVLAVPQDAPVLAYVGRLTGVKRPDRIADVVKILRVNLPDLVVLVAGDGEEGPAFRRRVAEERLPVRFLGWRDDVGTVMSAADGILLTSDNEGTPLTLIEAALLGRPVVATNVGAVPSVVMNGQTGWLAPPATELLARAAHELLTSPQEAQRRGRAAQDLARTTYSPDLYTAAHVDMYESLASERRHASARQRWRVVR